MTPDSREAESLQHADRGTSSQVEVNHLMQPAEDKQNDEEAAEDQTLACTPFESRRQRSSGQPSCPPCPPHVSRHSGRSPMGHTTFGLAMVRPCVAPNAIRVRRAFGGAPQHRKVVSNIARREHQSRVRPSADRAPLVRGIHAVDDDGDEVLTGEALGNEVRGSAASAASSVQVFPEARPRQSGSVRRYAAESFLTISLASVVLPASHDDEDWSGHGPAVYGRGFATSHHRQLVCP